MSVFKSNNAHEPVLDRRLVLLAEDHPLNQKVACLLLEQLGFDVHTVNDGAGAVKAVSATTYDAVLMDCHMPGMDGFEAARQIRAFEQDHGGHVPIIAVTALAMAGDRERCLSAGMDDYMTKPIDRDLLRNKLVYWMNPGSLVAAQGESKVICIFDAPISARADAKEDPVNAKGLFDSYGEEATELLRLFSSSSETILTQLNTLMDSGNCREVGRLAHELKGASWAVGADEMARLSVFLEQAAGQENSRLMHRTYSRMCHHFLDIKRFLDVQGLVPVNPAVEPINQFPN
jgi:CheY-like chemotaxis protein